MSLQLQELSKAFGPVSGKISVGGEEIPIFRSIPWHKDEPIDETQEAEETVSSEE